MSPNIYAAIEWLGTLVTIIATGLWCTRLFVTGLFRKYPAVLAFALASLVRSVVLYAYLAWTSEYFHLWLWTTVIVWLTQAAVLLELLHLIAGPYCEADQFCNKVALIFLTISTVVAFGIAHISANPVAVSPLMSGVVLVGRTLAWASAMTVILQQLFFTLFPVNRDKNVRRHRTLFVCYSLSVALPWIFVLSRNAGVARLASILQIIGTTIVAVLWASSFRASWERVNPEDCQEEDFSDLRSEGLAGLRLLDRIRDRLSRSEAPEHSWLVSQLPHLIKRQRIQ